MEKTSTMKYVLVLLFVLVPTVVWAQAYSMSVQMQPQGFQQITSLSTAQSLTVPTNTRGALICAKTQQVNWRDDGTAPTAAVGMILPAGQCMFYMGNLRAIQLIEAVASAALQISYYY